MLRQKQKEIKLKPLIEFKMQTQIFFNNDSIDIFFVSFNHNLTRVSTSMYINVMRFQI